MDILKSLGIKSKREKIVERLLSEKRITPSEAVILLRNTEHITIKVDHISSGARVITGDDNSTEYR